MTKKGLVSLMREINFCATSNKKPLIEHSIILLNRLITSLKQVIPKSVFSFTNTGANLASTVFPKEGFVFFGWIYIEAESSMCLWNLVKDQSLSLLIIDHQLVYNIKSTEEQATQYRLSERLESNKWYFVELYHVFKPLENYIVLYLYKNVEAILEWR